MVQSTADVELLSRSPAPPAYQRDADTTTTDESDHENQHRHNRLPADDGWGNDRPASVYRTNSIEDAHPPPAYIVKPPPYTAKKPAEPPAWLVAIGRFIKRHWKLVLCAVFLAIAVVVIVPCVFVFKIFKDRAQPEVDKLYLKGNESKLEISFDYEYDFVLSYSDTLIYNSDNRKTFSLNDFDDVTLYMDDTLPDIKPFARDLAFSDMDLNGSPDSSFRLRNNFYSYQDGDDQEEVLRLLKRLFQEDEVTVGMTANVAMKLKGLPQYPVKWNKTLAFKGFGGNMSFALDVVEFYKISGETNDSLGQNFRSYGQMQTPSLASSWSMMNGTESRVILQIGSIDVDVLNDATGAYIGHGNITIDKLPNPIRGSYADGTPYHGNSRFDCILNGTTIPALESAAAEADDGGVVPWRLRVTNVTSGGMQTYGYENFYVPWLAKAMEGMEFRVDVNVTEAVEYGNPDA
ncbi:hypothetical protein SLS56_004837 [Neofusicoccum ribis]|uniref:Uncharacterized protein n=1 Tax=Neofusicoccum ribis TaxID=45134 RepID=A0ABR3SV43_9PEZI